MMPEEKLKLVPWAQPTDELEDELELVPWARDQEPQGVAAPFAAETVATPGAPSPAFVGGRPQQAPLGEALGSMVGLLHRGATRFLIEMGRLEMGPSPRRDIFMSALAEAIEEGEGPFAVSEEKRATPEYQEHVRERRLRVRRAKAKIDPELLALEDQYMQEFLGFTGGPPETVPEKVAETAAGLGAFILRLRVAGRATKPVVGGLPRVLQAPVVWEFENQVGGGQPGTGAAMAFGLAAINKLPVRTIFKLGAETAAFGSLAAIQGADEVDIYINMAIPGTLRGINKAALAARLRGAQNSRDAAAVVWEIEQAGKQLRAERNLPEDYVPDPQTMMGLVRNHLARLKPGERTKAAKDRKTFRNMMGEEVGVIERVPITGQELPPETAAAVPRTPVEPIAGRPIPTTGPLVGKAAVEALKPAPKAVPAVKAKPITKKKVKEALQAAGVGKERARIITEKKTRADQIKSTKLVLDGAKEALAELKTKKASSDVINKKRAEVEALQGLMKQLRAPGKPIAPPKAVTQIITAGEIPGTLGTLRIGDTVTIGKAGTQWQIKSSGPRSTKEVPRILLERRVPVGEGITKARRMEVKASRVQRVPEAPRGIGLPEPVPTPEIQMPKPTTRGRLLYNLHDPSTFLVATRTKKGESFWMLRRPDGSRVRVDQRMVQELMDQGVVEKLGKDVWGIPDEQMYIRRELAEPIPVEPPVEVSKIEPSGVPAQPTVIRPTAPEPVLHVRGQQPVHTKARAESIARTANKRRAEQGLDPLESVPTEEGWVVQEVKRPAVAQVGTEQKPVVEQEIPERIRFYKSRPKVYEEPRPFEQFLRDWDDGRVQAFKRAPDQSPRGVFDWLVKSGRIKIKPEPRGHEAREARGLGPRLVTDVGSVAFRGPGGELTVGEFPPTLAAREPSPSAGLLRQQSELIRQLPQQQQFTLTRLYGMFGAKPQTYESIAKALGVSETRVETLEQEAILSLRKQMGVDEPGMTLEKAQERSMPGGRRGFIMIPPTQVARDIIGDTREIFSRAFSNEARDMIDGVGRTGGERGRNLEVFLRRIVDRQLEHHGNFQIEQVEAQKALNKVFLKGITDKEYRAVWAVQHQGYPRFGTTTMRRGLMSATQTWTIDRLPHLVEGRIEPRNAGEREIVRVAREAALSTGQLLEDTNFQNQARDGTWRRFTKDPDGRVFVNLSTTELYDVLMRGEQPGDSTYRRLITAYAEANTMPERKVRKIFDQRIRRIVTSNNPRFGFRHIGPEMERWFHNRPTGIKAENGKHIQLIVTEPRRYIDALYTSTAIRAGFAEGLGQDGKFIKRLRQEFTLPKDNRSLVVDPWKLDQALRTMSDLPPALFGKEPRQVPLGPDRPFYQGARGIQATFELVKQVFLTATAPVQISEPLGFGIVPRFYWPMMRGLRDALPFKPSREHVLAEIEQHRLITKDVISYIVDRSHAKSDLANKVAGVLSRVHLNKFANEALNEQPAALYGRTLIADIFQRAKQNKPTRATDVHFFRLLDYTPRQAIDLAVGNATSEQYFAAARRATRFFVGSTAISSQKSPLRNTRIYRFAIPFTSYFSNRFRMFDRHYQVLKQSWNTALRQGRAPLLDKDVLVSLKQAGQFLVGVELAGIAASFIWAGLREGGFGIQVRGREATAVFRDPFSLEAWGDTAGFLFDSFVYGSFGPVYGMFYDVMRRGAQVEGEPAEAILAQAMRVFLPASLMMDIHDAIKGVGPYKNRDGGERFTRFVKIHTPILNTVPAQAIGSLLGMQLEDRRVATARKAYWRWVLDPKNESVPALKKSKPSTEREDELYQMHMRRAKEAYLRGKDPFVHIFNAFEVKEGAADPSGTIRGWTLLDKGNLNDEKREKMQDDIGAEAYEYLREHDNGIRLLAHMLEGVSKMGRKKKALKSRMENLRLRLEEEMGP